MGEDFSIADESGDRKYFTIIPNYILNHSTLYDREVYIQMKRIAGEKGECWTSRASLAKKCGMSERRLDKSLRYLEEHHWIEPSGSRTVQTVGGPQQVKAYRIADLWKLNVDYYEKQKKGVAQNATPLEQRGSTDEAKGVAPGAHKEEPITKEEPVDQPEQSSGRRNVCFNPLGVEILKAFTVVDPTNKTYYSNTTQRAACDFLLSEYGLDNVLKRIGVLPKINKIPYFPTRPDDEQLCNKHLMEIIRARRPKFAGRGGQTYPETIREQYEQDPVTKVWHKTSA
jgi:hypothetical protein